MKLMNQFFFLSIFLLTSYSFGMEPTIETSKALQPVYCDSSFYCHTNSSGDCEIENQSPFLITVHSKTQANTNSLGIKKYSGCCEVVIKPYTSQLVPSVFPGIMTVSLGSYTLLYTLSPYIDESPATMKALFKLNTGHTLLSADHFDFSKSSKPYSLKWFASQAVLKHKLCLACIGFNFSGEYKDTQKTTLLEGFTDPKIGLVQDPLYLEQNYNSKVHAMLLPK